MDEKNTSADPIEDEYPLASGLKPGFNRRTIGQCVFWYTLGICLTFAAIRFWQNGFTF